MSRLVRLFKLNQFYFLYGIFFISLSYLIFEYFFIPYGAFCADEFVFARHIYEYTFHLPYRDFPPYKTVLGYYLFFLPLFFSHALLTPIFYIKYEIAIINALFLLFTAYLSSQLFNKKALLITFLSLLAMPLFLIYATELRVDMLTVWLCLFSILSLLQYKWRMGGFLLGIAFLISQKALWYLIAINGALALTALLFYPAQLKRILFHFNFAVLLPILIYIIFWSILSSPAIVFHNIFYEAYIQAGIQWYTRIYWACWRGILYHGPLLFFLWPLTFISLFQKKHIPPQRIFIITCSSLLMLLFITYKQPFPYNFVFLIPAFFFLYADFFSWLFKYKNHSIEMHHEAIFSLWTFYFFIFYLFFNLFIIYWGNFPLITYLTLLVPLCIYGFIYLGKDHFHSPIRHLLFYTALVLFVLTGIIYPLHQTHDMASRLDGGYQQTMIKLAAKLMDNKSAYISGIPLFYQNDQPIAGMKNLIGPELDYLYEPNDKLLPLLLPSLYLSPTTIDKVIADLEEKPVKMIVNNYRIHSLPTAISHYLKNHYQHFYGSIYLYSPKLPSGKYHFLVKFAGDYQISSESPIRINGKIYKANESIYLTKDDHLFEARKTFRLRLISHLPTALLKPKYREDKLEKMLKVIIQ